MPIQTAKNPWGSSASFDAQRSDLWQLDLSNPILGISQLLRQNASVLTVQGLQALVNAFPPPNSGVFYATGVTLPITQTDSMVVVRDSRPYPMPGADQPTGAVQATFLVDGATIGPPTSRLVALFTVWRALVRAGRGNFVPGELNLTLTNAVPLAGGATLQPQYRYTLPVKMLRGTNSFELSQNSADDPSQDTPMAVAYTHNLVNAWPSSMQLGALGTASGLQQLTVTFCCDAVINPQMAVTRLGS